MSVISHHVTKLLPRLHQSRNSKIIDLIYDPSFATSPATRPLTCRSLFPYACFYPASGLVSPYRSFSVCHLRYPSLVLILVFICLRFFHSILRALFYALVNRFRQTALWLSPSVLPSFILYIIIILDTTSLGLYIPLTKRICFKATLF